MNERSAIDSVPGVRTTTVRLPDDIAQALTEEAERQGVSTSEIVREGVVLRLALADALRTGSMDVLRRVLKALEEGKR